MLRITCLSRSERLASSVSVILLLSGESPPGSSSALELSILGLVRVMSSLLAVHRKHKGDHRLKHRHVAPLRDGQRRELREDVLGEPKLSALGVLRLRPPTRAASGGSSSLNPGSSSLGATSRQA